MKIETKRSLKDKVFTLHKDKVMELSIQALTTITTQVDFGPDSPVEPGVSTREIYALEDEHGTIICQAGEERCFNTKEELIKWLSNAK
jgi:hypothetical protein